MAWIAPNSGGIKVTGMQENLRLEEAREGKTPWKKWGPYLSERQWARCVKTIAATATPGAI